MKKLEFKQKTHEALRRQIQQSIEELDNEIRRLREDETGKYEDQYDMNEESQDEATHEILDKLTEQRNFLVEKRDFLNNMLIQEPLHEEVGPGSVVITNNGTFFISVATDDVKVDGKSVRGISKEAPIYEVLKDKKKGDTFTFRAREYQVKEVY